MKIALIGYGGVGKAFVRLLGDKNAYLQAQGLHIQLNYIIDLAGGIYEPDGIGLAQLPGFSPGVDFDALLKRRDIDLLVLTTPTNKETSEPGYSYIKAALASGIDVVTADKGPILLAYHELKQIARENRAQLAIGCTTGGALPAINAGLIELAGAQILSIEGVLNGTTNFILDEMRQKQISYAEALQTARQLGIAEPDPTLDVEGFDTAAKLLILTNALLGQHKTLADIDICGITGLTAAEVAEAARAGQKYKLVGRAAYQDGELVMTVAPQRLDAEHPFYMVDGKNKAVRYVSDTLGDLTVSGGASGVIPAAASLLRDIINIHRGYNF